ncbi:ATP-grasp fold amidoligase family protein [Vibrio lentus]|uniref:ATP-grasp fold amidoligase family protein n=1 Tax=Vibrio lentus TaxID=136468 RepID=UPI000C83B3F0|nr:ATP-grasp fold amidoligase family protein [Vibrio lentus]PMH92274.1 hypothetical protein BCU56_09755 [Vibrio lentus]
MLVNSLRLKWLKYINDEVYLSLIYRKRFGKPINLKNPKGFNEKLQWLKINYRTSLMTTCADKAKVRGYVKDTIGDEYLIPLVGIYDQWEDIVWDSLPTQFAMKANNSSGMNIISMDKNELNEADVALEVHSWFEKNYFYDKREWQYKNIAPKIVVENLLLDSKGNVPSDIKIHCFKKDSDDFEFVIQVDEDRFGEHKQAYFDKDWNQLDIEFSSKSFKTDNTLSNDTKRPALLEEVLDLTKKIAQPFCYSRIDFFIVDNKIYFGEVTFHHHSGFSHISSDWDLELGKKIRLEM